MKDAAFNVFLDVEHHARPRDFAFRCSFGCNNMTSWPMDTPNTEVVFFRVSMGRFQAIPASTQTPNMNFSVFEDPTRPDWLSTGLKSD